MIAFDAKSGADDDTGSNSTLTVAHTCTGLNGYLVVGVLTNNSAYASGCTYNGVAMTRIQDLTADGTIRITIFGIVSPATGTHNIVATATGNTLIRLRASSYTGVLQTGQPDAKTTTAAGATSPMTTTLATVLGNCWTMLFVRSTGATVTASTGSTERAIAATSGDTKFFDSNASLSAGNNSMAVTFPAGTAAAIMISLSPVPSSGSFMLFSS